MLKPILGRNMQVNDVTMSRCDNFRLPMLAPMMFSQPEILASGNMLLSSHIRLRRLGDWLSRKENMASRLDTTDHGWIMLSWVYYFFPLLWFKINSLNYWPPGGMQAIYKSYLFYLLVVASIPKKDIINLVYYSSQRLEINATSQPVVIGYMPTYSGWWF